jgi:peptidyl-prolyl cis-trans isomerase SurA
MKNIILNGWIGIVLSLNALVWGQEVVDGIVAIVGDEIILRTELLQATQAFAVQMGMNPRTQLQELEKLKKDILQNLIHEKVLLAKAEEDTITVDDQQVEAELEARVQGLIQQLGSKEKVEAYFGSPIKKIKRDYRDDIRKHLIVQAVQQSKFRDVQISRPEVEDFYESMKDSLPEKEAMVKLRHILMEVQSGEESRQKAVERLREIQGLLRQGENFEELARKYSEDPGTAERGGALGFVERGTLFQSFEETAFQLQPGEVSDIVETPVGLHLIQMVEKRGDKANMRHILIRLEVTQQDEREVIEQMNHIRERLLAGEDFIQLVNEYSEDASTKEEGGDLGWLPLEQLQIEAFKSAVDTLQEGQTSKPFRTQFGYHIIKLEGRREARVLSLEEDWEQIKEWALNMKKQRVLDQWIKEIKKDLYIEIKEDLL